MQDPAFSAPGKFFKGNLHTHSNVSDGALPPEEVCKRYRENGYDFLALTDHFVGAYGYPITNTLPFRTNSFTTMLGAELHSGAMENGEIWHILAVGLPENFDPSNSPRFTPSEDQESGPEIAKRAYEAGAFVAIAHPEWSGLTMNDARSIAHAHAVEIYNHGCEVECDRGRGFYVLDQLLSENRKLTLCATDDAHFHAPDQFGGWVMVKAEANEPEALLDALKAGRHYSSTGPEIHNIVWGSETVEVECSPACNIAVLGFGSRTAGKNGKGITHAEIATNALSHSKWMRISVTDENGKSAWSNPVYRDQL
ncbi:MAG: CehA/McbA family metallohydrolase [Rhizobiaceae bacterium]|nr:CehA/McbA family metallohydrolase [Rhizobiaceae bacterium]